MYNYIEYNDVKCEHKKRIHTWLDHEYKNNVIYTIYYA